MRFKVRPRRVGTNMSIEVEVPGGNWVSLILSSSSQYSRIDNVIIRRDAWGNRQLEVLSGRPHTSANFKNLFGVTATPSNAEHIAYIHVPAGCTAIGHNNIHHDPLEAAVTALEDETHVHLPE